MAKTKNCKCNNVNNLELQRNVKTAGKFSDISIPTAK